MVGGGVGCHKIGLAFVCHRKYRLFSFGVSITETPFYLDRSAAATRSSSMPSSLQKTRKHIAKKRNGEVNALHAKSRDSLRLHKAGVRDQRLEKLAAARSKKEQPIGTISIFKGNFI